MNLWIQKGGLLALALGVMSATSPARAAEPTEPPPIDEPIVEEDYGYILPEELDDAPFAMYVDITLLEPAWSTRDAQLLTDLALQLAQGEKLLMRSHKAGSAEDLLSLAVKIAQSIDNKEALERIANAADALQYDDVASLAQNAK